MFQNYERMNSRPKVAVEEGEGTASIVTAEERS